MRLGVLGMSHGNAHSYSWASIVNGPYDAEKITKVCYPGVAAYLNANKETLGINSARVTYVWTQDRKISESIATSNGIENTVKILKKYKKMKIEFIKFSEGLKL